MTSIDHKVAVPTHVASRRTHLQPTEPSQEDSAPLLAATVAVAERRVTVAGELDLATAHILTEAVTMLAQVAQALTITVDLAGLRFLDVVGLGALEKLRRDQARGGVLLLLINPPRIVAEMCIVAGLWLATDQPHATQHQWGQPRP